MRRAAEFRKEQRTGKGRVVISFLGQQSEGEIFKTDRDTRFVKRREFRWKRLEWPVVFVMVFGRHKSERHFKSLKYDNRAGKSVLKYLGGDRLWGESRRRG